MDKPKIEKAICVECNQQYGYDSYFQSMLNKRIADKTNSFSDPGMCYMSLSEDDRYEVDLYFQELRESKMQNCLVIEGYALCRYHLHQYSEKIYNS